MPGLFSIMFPIVFFLILGVFIVFFVRGIAQWSKNNKSPKLSVEATIVSKSRHSSTHNTGDSHMHTSTSFHVTFEVNSGDRMVFQMPGQEYNMLAERDRGMLHFQGTRYLGFDRFR